MNVDALLPQPDACQLTRRDSLRYAALAVALSWVYTFLSPDLQAEEKPAKALPLPGESWSLEGHEAFVILPAKSDKQGSTPWVWYAPTLPGLPGGAEKWMFERFAAAGIAIAGIDVGESYGSPRGRALYSALYHELTTKRGFASKPVLLARSRGGLMTLNWAVENPDKVGGFAGIYPVCNLTSYPGVAKASGTYEMTADELQGKLKEQNPVERLEALAKAGVPLFAIQGDSDKTVPLEKNSGEVQRRYREFGGQMQLIVPKDQGHNMWPGFFQCQELVDFVIANAKP
jgi:pimeloyl-ACP methyl ester carboxylesterase